MLDNLNTLGLIKSGYFVFQEGNGEANEFLREGAEKPLNGSESYRVRKTSIAVMVKKEEKRLRELYCLNI